MITHVTLVLYMILNASLWSGAAAAIIEHNCDNESIDVEKNTVHSPHITSSMSSPNTGVVLTSSVAWVRGADGVL